MQVVAVAGATLFFTTGIAVLMGGEGGNLGFLHLIAGVDLTRTSLELTSWELRYTGRCKTCFYCGGTSFSILNPGTPSGIKG